MFEFSVFFYWYVYVPILRGIFDILWERVNVTVRVHISVLPLGLGEQLTADIYINTDLHVYPSVHSFLFRILKVPNNRIN